MSGEELGLALEEFVASQGIDDRAAEALREAQPRVIQAVLERGDLSDCRNPSSAVLGRLRDAQSGKGASKGGGKMMGGGFGGFGPSGGGFGGKGGFGGMGGLFGMG